MKPYYEDGSVTIYQGDCREILPAIRPTTIITDPVWPNARVPMFGHDDPEGMLRQMLEAAGPLIRLAVEIGCDSDPRFLSVVPAELPFFRVAWLELVRMGYKGRLGMTGDIGYLFGTPPASRPGARIIPACHLKHHGNLAKPPSSNGLLEAPLPHKTVDPTRVAIKQAIYDAETEEEKREALQRFQEHVSTTREASGDG